MTAAPGTEPWAVHPADAQAVACMLTRDVTVSYWPRSAVHEVWAARHDGRPLPVNPWSFRAWSSGNNAVIFVDETETYESVLWLLLHELTHLDMINSRFLRLTYRRTPRPANYLSSDDAHESHPEEALANLTATTAMTMLGHQARPYDRRWWRRRVQTTLRLRYLTRTR